ncbi:MAG TPA: HAD family hydrolase [Candidatus Dormibacteraeota bacterium]|jgi:hypothetical protein|nr:HAD family hydrolase [Candidatus Dormibacteraeota bacterium]
MRISALATDYDGTIARDGRVSPSTLAALYRWKASERRLILVTGRVLPDLHQVFPGYGLFDGIVAENGAVLHLPDGSLDQVLGSAPPPALVASWKRARIPFFTGSCIVATKAEYLAEVQPLVEANAPSWQIILNKDSLMVLPSGIDKGNGLRVMIELLDVPLAEVAACGDAENDISMLTAVGLGVAVANALPSVKAAAKRVTLGADGDGVAELIDLILTDSTS